MEINELNVQIINLNREVEKTVEWMESDDFKKLNENDQICILGESHALQAYLSFLLLRSKRESK